jgi:tripartite-type tricarboxylate transporter receptor subunit TctC
MTRLTRRAALATALLPIAAGAQEAWPNRDFRLIVPFPAGGTTDVVARLLAAEMGQRLGRPMVVDNLAGAGGMIGAQRFVRDGNDHTLFLSQIASNAIVPALQRNPGYDPERDFRPVTEVVTVPNVWLANPTRTGTRDVREYMRRVRATPPGRPFGSAGNGTSTHLTGELVSQLAGLRMQHVPFRGAAPAMTALIAGDIEVFMDNLPTALPQIRGGAVVALAVTSAQRVPELPDVPALGELGAEFGLAGFESVAWFGLSAHPSVSDANLARFVAAAEAAMGDPAIRRQLAERGTTPTGGGPEPYARLIRAERERWARVVREGNIQVD